MFLSPFPPSSFVLPGVPAPRLSSTPSFKMLFLAILTAALIVFGALALFVAGEDSIYHAFW